MALIQEAAIRPITRIATKPSKTAKKKRVDEKKRRSDVKRTRSGPMGD